MRYGLSGASLATFGDKILISGGVGVGGILKAVKRLLVYDIRTNEWQKGPSMNQVMFRSSHFSFLVFGHFWRRSLHLHCLHFARQDGQDEKNGKKITKVTKIPKTKRRKYGMNKTKI